MQSCLGELYHLIRDGDVIFDQTNLKAIIDSNATSSITNIIEKRSAFLQHIRQIVDHPDCDLLIAQMADTYPGMAYLLNELKRFDSRKFRHEEKGILGGIDMLMAAVTDPKKIRLFSCVSKLPSQS